MIRNEIVLYLTITALAVTLNVTAVYGADHIATWLAMHSERVEAL